MMNITVGGHRDRILSIRESTSPADITIIMVYTRRDKARDLRERLAISDLMDSINAAIFLRQESIRLDQLELAALRRTQSQLYIQAIDAVEQHDINRTR